MQKVVCEQNKTLPRFYFQMSNVCLFLDFQRSHSFAIFYFILTYDLNVVFIGQMLYSVHHRQQSHDNCDCLGCFLHSNHCDVLVVLPSLFGSQKQEKVRFGSVLTCFQKLCTTLPKTNPWWVKTSVLFRSVLDRASHSFSATDVII